MKLLLLGRDGQVGWELQRSLATLGQLVALGSRDRDPSGDLADPAALEATVREERPDVIVNAAAYTAVDQAESEPERAQLINATAVGVLARAAADVDALLVHYSTDYVYDGTGTRPWRETDPMEPCNAYGASKADGDRQVQASGCRHLIFRTSWVYAARGRNFVRTMLKLATERDSLAVVDDQWGVPTGAELIADVSARALPAALSDPGLTGTYHLAPSGETNWHEYASYLIELAISQGLEARVAPDAIQGIATRDYPTAAKRPANSRLDTTQLRNRFGVVLPDWRHGVGRAVCEVLGR